MGALDEKAIAAGLSPGMPLADARAILPTLATAEWDRDADAAALRRLARWCGLFVTPWAAPCSTAEGQGAGPGGAGGLMLDVTGCAHLFSEREGEADDEAALLRALLERLRGLGFTARAGLAGTPGAAWALARFSSSSASPWTRLSPGGEVAALADLPPMALRLSPAEVEFAARLGLDRIGDLLRLPRATLAPRFGKGLLRRLTQALGEEDEPISPLDPISPHRVFQRFAEPLATAESLNAVLEALLPPLCRLLEKEGLGARRLLFSCARLDGRVLQLARGTSKPSRDPDDLARLFRDALPSLDPGFGVEVVSLSALISEPLAAEQLRLGVALSPDPGGHEKSATVFPSGLADRLAARLGAEAVTRLLPVESHIPERAARHRPLLRQSTKERRDKGAPTSGRLGAARPLRLLPRPETIEAMALLPDHPPVKFRWRRLLHHVARAEGPERITPEWWSRDPEEGEAPPRDYFRIEDRNGRRYWIYRAAGRWYLQGLFA